MGKAELTAKVLEGRRVSRSDALDLWHLFEFTELASLAQEVRFRHNPERKVTYLIDRNIN